MVGWAFPRTSLVAELDVRALNYFWGATCKRRATDLLLGGGVG